jgi:hypothetical protein
MTKNLVLARAHSCCGDFRTALAFEKETFSIYSRIFGKDHEKTLVSNERLNHLAKQAVALQKHMNDATHGLKSSKQLMPNVISNSFLQILIIILIFSFKFNHQLYKIFSNCSMLLTVSPQFIRDFFQ